MLRLLAPVAALGLIAAPTLAATTTRTTVKHHVTKVPARAVAVRTTRTTTRTTH